MQNQLEQAEGLLKHAVTSLKAVQDAQSTEHAEMYAMVEESRRRQAITEEAALKAEATSRAARMGELDAKMSEERAQENFMRGQEELAEARLIAEELYRELNSIQELKNMALGGLPGDNNTRVRKGLWTLKSPGGEEEATLTGIKSTVDDWGGLGGFGREAGEGGALDDEEAKMTALEEGLRNAVNDLEKEKEDLVRDNQDKGTDGRIIRYDGIRSGSAGTKRAVNARLPRPPSSSSGDRGKQRPFSATAPLPLPR